MLRQWLRQLWRPAEATIVKTIAPLRREAGVLQAGDHVLLHPIRSGTSPVFAGSLTPGKNLKFAKGKIPHDAIIGRRVRDLVDGGNAKQRSTFRISIASLEDYVKQTGRLVTPIYPCDANLIVSLLDLHPERPHGASDEVCEPDLHILEAGTGHGSLTLHLSRAIHAANVVAPQANAYSTAETYETALAAWKKTRRAVLTSIDVSADYSKHASKLVKAFRHGMYHDNVDFHVSDVSTWIKTASERQPGKSLLTHAFLDLPGVEKHIQSVAEALCVDGPLIVFTPSITQIIEVLNTIRNDKLPLVLDKVVELGVNGGSGGREWDVRFVQPRAAVKKRLEASQAQSSAADVDSNDIERLSTTDEATIDSPASENSSVSSTESSEAAVAEDTPFVTVCRPKVGDRITGGGFLAVLRKQSDKQIR